MSNENKAELHELDEDELHELDMVASQRDFAAPISYWAHVFALELSRLNGGNVSVSMAIHPYAQAFTKAAIDGALTVRDKVAMLPVTVNDKAHPNFLFNEVLVAKDDLRAWVVEHCPDLRTRLLGFDMHDEQRENASPVQKPVHAETSEAGANPLPQTWWRTDYDIMSIAQSAGDSLRRKGEKTSNRSIGDAVALEIETRERAGKKRKGPDGQTIKNTDLRGWEYLAE